MLCCYMSSTSNQYSLSGSTSPLAYWMQLEQYYINEGISLVHTKKCSSSTNCYSSHVCEASYNCVRVFPHVLFYAQCQYLWMCKCLIFFSSRCKKKCGMGTRLDRYDLVMRGLRYKYTKWQFTPPMEGKFYVGSGIKCSRPWRGNFMWGTQNFPSITREGKFYVVSQLT